MHIEFEIEGEKHISAVLGFSADNIGDFKKPLYRTGQLIMTDVENNFNLRGRLFGGWKPRVYSRPWPLLEQTGRMRRSWNKNQTRDAIKVSNFDPKFKYHQSNKPRKKLPRRVMLTIIPVTRNSIFKAFQEHAVDSLRGRSL